MYTKLYMHSLESIQYKETHKIPKDFEIKTDDKTYWFLIRKKLVS